MLNPVSHPTIRCLECDAKSPLMYIQTKAHLKLKHNMTKEEYLKLHPEQKKTEFWGTPYSHWRARRKHQEAGGVERCPSMI